MPYRITEEKIGPEIEQPKTGPRDANCPEVTPLNCGLTSPREVSPNKTGNNGGAQGGY